LLPLLHNDVSFDLSDFSPISALGSSPNVLVVHPSLPVYSVKQLIAIAKKRPTQLSYASGGAGSTLHLSAELFKSMAKINILHVPYKSGGAGMLDLLGGRVQVMFPVAAAAIPYEKASRLRILAVTSSEPSVLIPGVPTIAAVGLPGYSSELTVGIFAPVDTPTAIIERLNNDISRLLEQQNTKDRFFQLGLNTVESSPNQLKISINSEIVKWAKVIKEMNIQAD
jgi:tripartite-type tricarboxylate transporter receptor subunit TctC